MKTYMILAWLIATPALADHGTQEPPITLPIAPCWSVDPASDAARVKGVVAFSLTLEGRVIDDVRAVSLIGGDTQAQADAFGAIRRAILRCQGQAGYNLPSHRYDEWRDITLTFDPTTLEIR